MQYQTQQDELFRYLRLLRKRWWLVVIPPLVLIPAVALYSMTLPNRFRSSTMILVTPQKLPSNFVASTVTSDIQDRLNTIRQQVLSRTVLEKVATDLSMFPMIRDKVSTEEIVEIMRRNVTISVAKGGRGADSFEIAYVDADPRMAMMVTNQLASFFIEENLKVREQQAVGTSQFLSDEIERYREEIRAREADIYSFKRRNMNESTEQLASNQARLAELQNRLQINAQNINSAKDRKVLLQQQLAEIEKTVEAERERHLAEARSRRQREAADAAGTFEDESKAPVTKSAGAMEIARQREELARLRLTHTERHPDVVRLAAYVRKLEEDEAKSRGTDVPEPRAGGKTRQNRVPLDQDHEVRIPYPPAYQQIKADLLKVDQEIARTSAQNEEIQKAVELYQSRIASTPARELQLKQLSEGYTNVKAVLDSLVDKKLQADLSENMERKQKGEQFRILDPANLPERPVSPNRAKWVAGGALGGVALGVGLALLLELLNRGVKSREELAVLLGLPVLGVIPTIVTPDDRLRRRRITLRVSGAAVACAVVAAALVHLTVRPLPQAAGDLYSKIRTTHWTAMR